MNISIVSNSDPDIEVKLRAIQCMLATELTPFGLILAPNPEATSACWVSGRVGFSEDSISLGGMTACLHAGASRVALTIHNDAVYRVLLDREPLLFAALRLARLYRWHATQAVEFADAWIPVVEELHRSTGINLLINPKIQVHFTGTILFRGMAGCTVREPLKDYSVDELKRLAEIVGASSDPYARSPWGCIRLNTATTEDFRMGLLAGGLPDSVVGPATGWRDVLEKLRRISREIRAKLPGFTETLMTTPKRLP